MKDVYLAFAAKAQYDLKFISQNHNVSSQELIFRCINGGILIILIIFLNGCIARSVHSDFVIPSKNSSVNIPSVVKFRLVKINGGSFRLSEDGVGVPFGDIDHIMRKAIQYYPNIFSDGSGAIPIAVKFHSSLKNRNNTMALMFLIFTAGIVPFPGTMEYSKTVRIFLDGEQLSPGTAYKEVETQWTSVLSPLGLIPVPGDAESRKSETVFSHVPEPLDYNIKLFIGAITKSLIKTSPITLQQAYSKYSANKQLMQYDKPGQSVLASTLIPSYKLHAINIADLRYHALIIANNNYRYLPKLKSPHNDAKTLSGVLRTKYNFEIQILKDATRDDIIKALRKYEKNLSDKDCLIIYYAGYSWLDEKTKTGFWLPVDANLKDESNWIENAYISRVAKASNSRHILVVSNSCFTYKLPRSINVLTTTAENYHKLLTRRSRTVMTSGGNEPVLDSSGKGNHSVFASALIDALENNNNKSVSGTELFSIVRHKVVLDSKLQPEYSDMRKSNHESGDFIFLLK